MCRVHFVVRKPVSKSRSGCPVCVSLEQFGDRWSLLIIRDLMVRGYRTFREFQHAGEGIATNVLASRLHKLAAHGIISAEPATSDGRSIHSRLTPKGIALAPVMLELLIWAARHDETAAPCGFVEEMERNRQAVLDETYRRWKQRDTTPLIPPFPSPTRTQARRKSR
jgi:DNA-binding HxlR family transcriptional regulator